MTEGLKGTSGSSVARGRLIERGAEGLVYGVQVPGGFGVLAVGICRVLNGRWFSSFQIWRLRCCAVGLWGRVALSSRLYPDCVFEG